MSNNIIVQVGSTLIDIRTDGAAAGPAVAAAAPTSSAHGHHAPAAEFSRQAGIPVAGKILTTPAVRKIAKENHLDLHRIPGSGPKGRILKEDVLNFIAGKTAPSSSNKAAAAPVAPVAHKPAAAGASSSHSAPVVTAADQRVPIRGIQRMMVKSMTESLQVMISRFVSFSMSFRCFLHVTAPLTVCLFNYRIVYRSLTWATARR